MTSENLQDVVGESQVFQIQQQILAYKSMIKTASIPKDVEKNLFALSKDQWEVEKERLLQRTVKYYHEKVEKNDDLKNLINRYKDKKSGQPPTEQGTTGAGLANGQEQEQGGMEVELIKKNPIIERRKQEIDKLIKSGCLTKQAQLKLTLESKFLDSVPFYYEVKDTILRRLIEDKPGPSLDKELLDRRRHTRERPPRKQEHRMMEKIENQMKTEQEFRKKIRHREFVQLLFEHQARFFEHHKRIGKLVKKRGIAVKNYLEMAEKRGKYLQSVLEYLNFF